MQRSIRKSDKSVKAGLEIAAHTKKIKKTGTQKPTSSQGISSEKDEDDLVHRPGTKRPKKKEEEDMDDLVHQKRRPVKVNPAEEQDIDDLMHPGIKYKRDQ